LALAACLLGNPEVLILDEPTNGLDPEGIALVRNIIIEESKVGKTIILASHILDEVEKVCTHVIVLKKGSFIISGTVNDVLKGDTKYHIISENNTLLQDVLEKNDTIKTWNIEGETLIITLKENIDIKQVSLLAMENKILITSLESKKKTLEAEFLQLVK
jgi:ABC-2 type transport system ATP-binding protein